MQSISKLSDYAIKLLCCLAVDRNHWYSARDLHQKTSLSLATTSKLLKLMCQKQLVCARRGATGGYQLQLDPMDISLWKVVCAIDGIPYLVACQRASSACALESCCQQMTVWSYLNQSWQAWMQQVRLTDFLNRRLYDC